jgi:uncharacterized MAPEG superfamily protein
MNQVQYPKEELVVSLYCFCGRLFWPILIRQTSQKSKRASGSLVGLAAVKQPTRVRPPSSPRGVARKAGAAALYLKKTSQRCPYLWFCFLISRVNFGVCFRQNLTEWRNFIKVINTLCYMLFTLITFCELITWRRLIKILQLPPNLRDTTHCAVLFLLTIISRVNFRVCFRQNLTEWRNFIKVINTLCCMLFTLITFCELITWRRLVKILQLPP